MPPPGRHIYLWPRVTLTFDLLSRLKVDNFMLLPSVDDTDMLRTQCQYGRADSSVYHK